MGRALLAILLVGCAGRVHRERAVDVVESAPRARARLRPAPRPEPVVHTISLEDDAVPGGSPCESTSACGQTQQCRGPAGCGASWACGAARECGSATVSYCGCDGTTFYALENCPGAPYLNVGPCAAMGPDAETEGAEVVEGNVMCTSQSDCSSGLVCAGIEGCTTHWTCVRRRRVRCAQVATTFCSCGGESFSSPSTCPGRPFLHRGECGAPATAPPPRELAGSPPPGVDPRRELGDPR